MPADSVTKLHSRLSKKYHIKDADKDGRLLDDILASSKNDAEKLKLAMLYLAELGKDPSVTAKIDPAHPERMIWQQAGVSTFLLSKGDGFVRYKELDGGEFKWNFSGASRLFNFNPWLIKLDAKAGADAAALRDPELWIKRYEKSADQAILSPEQIELFNRQDSQEVAKVDAQLDELPSTMPFGDVLQLVSNAYFLGSNAHMLAVDPCNLGAAGNKFSGTLSEKHLLVPRDWDYVAAEFGFPVRAVDMSGQECKPEGAAAKKIEQGSTLDFSKAGDPKQLIEIGYGILTNQADLRAIPSESACYDSDSPSSDDGCEFHRPQVEPVRVLWSAKNWSFVKTQQEYGWVKNENLAQATRADVDRLLKGEVVVTDFTHVQTIDGNNIRLGMGTHLPLAQEMSELTFVWMPMLGEARKVRWEMLALPKSSVSVRPQYTYANMVRQLFKTTPAVWLLANKSIEGKDGHVEGADCSGMTGMVAKVAGLILGRNSGSAQGFAGTRLWERNKDLSEQSAVPTAENAEATWKTNLSHLAESQQQMDAVLTQWDKDMKSGKARGMLLLGWPGHVAIFLGFDEKGRAMVISSLSRTKRTADDNAESAAWKAKTDDVWTLAPTVTPLNMGTDPVSEQLITRGNSRPIDWYNRVSFIQELVPAPVKAP